MLHQVNPYVRIFKTALAFDGPNAKITLHADSKVDRRRYNLPRAPEIAAFIPDAAEDSKSTRDIVLYKRDDGRVKLISEVNPAADPMHFVLLFPRGEQGWSINIPLQPKPGSSPQASGMNIVTHFDALSPC
jgi:hypothetical protein